MIVRLIIAKVLHNRIHDYTDLVKNKWGPLLEKHGGKFLGVFVNIEKTEHEVIGLMRFNSMEHQRAVTEAMKNDEQFPRLTAVMQPMLQRIEIRLIEPVE
ncbi:NIPSNAP family protein [Candidatus Sumerlaeota bacterium]|nr:NIPSNAP family protein [Candidatus Sumerlaeota bacterium]